MCRACDEGGRRCPKTGRTRAAERAASKRYYQRKKARAQIALLAAQGIPAMDDMDCPTTYHMGTSLDLEDPPERKDSGANKPPGLWASPGREGGGGVMTSWTDRSVIENGIAPSRQKMFALTPAPGAWVIRLDNVEDIAAFGRAFDFDREGHAGKLAAWREVRESGVDGVMLTANGVSAAKRLRYGTSRNDDPSTWAVGDTLENWDESSVVWLRNDRLSVEEVQMGEYPEHVLTPEEEEEMGGGWGHPPVHDLDPVEGLRSYDEGRPTAVKTGTDGASTRVSNGTDVRHAALINAPEWTASDGRRYFVVSGPRDITMRTADGEMVGYINWAPSGEIGNVNVREPFQRTGMASEMLRRAREVDPDVRHSDRLSDDAVAWLRRTEPEALSGIE